MSAARWLLWIGAPSTTLHAIRGLSQTKTACGITAQMTGPYGISLPPGKYTHCDVCRRVIGD